MEAFIPAIILDAFKLIDPQVWVWIRFSVLVWFTVGCLVAVWTISYHVRKALMGDTDCIPGPLVIWRMLKYGTLWPFYLLGWIFRIVINVLAEASGAWWF